MNEISLKKITSAEAADVESMARRIWPDAYREIITREQIDYMLGWMYAPAAIAAEITERGIHYYWIDLGGETVGFLAVGPVLPDKPAMLHKCYLLNEKHGCGLGTKALEAIFELLAEAGVPRLDLRVNRHNLSAVSFYRKNGFRIVEEDVADIGCGFVMDDFIMSRVV